MHDGGDLSMIEFVCATRLSQQAFWQRAPLGLSLLRLRDGGQVIPHISFMNSTGLPQVYNARLLAADSPEWLVFLHDDVWIDDIFIADRIMRGLNQYAVIGVAGNRRCLPGHAGWMFAADDLSPEEPDFLSGGIAHGTRPFGQIRHFGAAPADCELLDGVFLALHKPALRAAGVCFDPRFSFHFHDLDFCRAARAAGLNLGTWPIALTHCSHGESANTPSWHAGLAAYRAKYRKTDRA
jgi:GT2 family glycosyltransferase